MIQNEILRAEIAEHVSRYLARGGKITYLPMGLMAHPLEIGCSSDDKETFLRASKSGARKRAKK